MTLSWERSARMAQTVGVARGREQMVCRGISPWLAPLAMVTTQDLALPLWFRSIAVAGRSHIPREGPVLLAPTHKARWDALLLPHAAGRRVTGRDCRFMVTIDEMRGLQGWLLQRLGCFAVDQLRPSLASLRYAVELLEAGQQLVVFPEGRIRREGEVIRLHQGLARLALMGAGRGVPVPVVPVGIAYGHPRPRPCDRAAIHFGQPMWIHGEGRNAAVAFTHQLAASMAVLERRAAAAIGLEPEDRAP
ncbi:MULTISPECIES: lysophospholipid acyltransferase family protein [Aphanothece]|uniref:lysophospholipid acyltransferase family protein n=1 Tax=Aphanothece TaxID=1121 RepID=UPI0039851D06